MKDDTATATTAAAFSRLYTITQTLRSKQGCPWDKDQTALSLRRDLIEEAFEVIDAITQNDAAHVQEELGDVLFNAVLLAYTYEQAGSFTLADSLTMISDKLIRRHPHVFAESEGASEMTAPVTDSAAVLQQWDSIKENVEGRTGASVLDSVPKGFPPLLKAYKLLAKAAKKHFVWPNADAALAKIQEELTEAQEAAEAVAQCKRNAAQQPATATATSAATAPATAPQPTPFTVNGGTPALNAAQLHLEEELGDVLFAVVSYARMLGVDASVALERANRKFYKRFTFVEQSMAQHELPMDGTHNDAISQFWNAAKQQEA